MNNSICTLFDNILIDIHKFKSLQYFGSRFRRFGSSFLRFDGMPIVCTMGTKDLCTQNLR